MKFRKNIILYLILSLFLAGCTTTGMYNTKKITKLVDSTIQDSLLAQSHWGILVESIEQDLILYQQNSDKLFIPASNQKILTSAAAINLLNSDFSYQTNLLYSGEIVDSTLSGDLIIQGYGDPTMTADFFDDPRQVFYNWADTLKAYGIKKINGNIIGDDNAFDGKRWGNGWMIEDLNYSYAPEIGALQFNDNVINLKIVPPSNSEKSIKIFPQFESSYFSFIDHTVVMEDSLTKLVLERPLDNNIICISGNVKAGDRTIPKAITMRDPTMFFLTILKETLNESGIEISGDVIDCDDIDEWQSNVLNLHKLTDYHSPLLPDILGTMMEESNNLQAETIIRTLAVRQGEIGSFVIGKQLVQDFLEALELSPDAYRFSDGSGLSRYNLLSPQQIVHILKFMHNSEKTEFWKDIMPVFGNYDLENGVILRPSTNGNIRAKTGTMSNIRCLSGYIELPDDLLVFSFMVNNHLLRTFEIDSIIYKILITILNNSKR
jgi:serine-type D-Ala-D-Ala carboxypeptidase/endopeptidase (penicillin-binding protein 4)